MKKIFWVFVCCFLPVDFIFADPIGLGIKAGANMANQVDSFWSNNQALTTDVLFGLNAGVFAEFGLNDFLRLQPEAEFTMKGVQANLHNVLVTGSGGPYFGYTSATYTQSYNYLEIPVLLKADKNLGPGFKGSLSIGPEVSLLLGANSHYSIAFNGFTGNQPLKGASLEAGAVFGAGIEFTPFLLDLCYDLGLTSVDVNNGNGPSVTNSVLSLSFGYRIQ